MQVRTSAFWQPVGKMKQATYGLVLLLLGGVPSFTSADALDGMQNSMACPGDVNGDGVPDLIVGLRQTNRGDLNGDWNRLPVREAVFVISGADGALLHAIEPDNPGDAFGRSASPAGDVDRDGCDDVLVGATPQHLTSGGFLEGGRAFLYSGRSGELIRVLRSEEGADGFGFCVAGGRDVTGDGVPDQAIGAPGLTDTGVGAVHVFSGSDGARVRVIRPEAPTRSTGKGRREPKGFGTSVTLLPDLNNDNLAEIVVGDPGDVRETLCGAIHVFSGGDGARMATLLSHSVGARHPDSSGLGWVVCGVGDLDGDGMPDFAATALNGHIEAFSGRDFSRLWGRSLSAHTGDSAGSSLVSIGDLNGDGIEDLAVGANESWDLVQADPGFAKVLSGRDGEILWTYTPKLPANDGVDVCSLGDINNDGVEEFVIHQIARRSIIVINGATFKEVFTVNLDDFERAAVAADKTHGEGR